MIAKQLIIDQCKCEENSLLFITTKLTNESTQTITIRVLGLQLHASLPIYLPFPDIQYFVNNKLQAQNNLDLDTDSKVFIDRTPIALPSRNVPGTKI